MDDVVAIFRVARQHRGGWLSLLVDDVAAMIFRFLVWAHLGPQQHDSRWFYPALFLATVDHMGRLFAAVRETTGCWLETRGCSFQMTCLRSLSSCEWVFEPGREEPVFCQDDWAWVFERLSGQLHRVPSSHTRRRGCSTTVGTVDVLWTRHCVLLHQKSGESRILLQTKDEHPAIARVVALPGERALVCFVDEAVLYEQAGQFRGGWSAVRTFSGGGDMRPIFSDFDVDGVPKYVLVDAGAQHGCILFTGAYDVELDRAELECRGVMSDSDDTREPKILRSGYFTAGDLHKPHVAVQQMWLRE